MQLIYISPFMLASLICGSICLATQNFRRYGLQFFVAPTSFGVCSIIGIIPVLAILHVAAFGQRVQLVADAIFIGVYLASGVLGAWVAVLLALKIQARFSR